MAGSDYLGVLACGLVLCTFAMTSMVPLRLVAMASNVSFIAYAWSLELWPVLALHAALLPLNAFRLRMLVVDAVEGCNGGGNAEAVIRPTFASSTPPKIR
jgi:hypothetical protein